MIRKATPSDINKIVELGIESLEVNGDYEEFIISEARVRQVAIECVSSAKNYAWVSEIDGEVVGAVIAMSTPLFFFERNQCSVVMYYCRIPKDGGRLLKNMFNWYKSRPNLLHFELTLEARADGKIAKFLEKMGMEPSLPAYSHRRGRS